MTTAAGYNYPNKVASTGAFTSATNGAAVPVYGKFNFQVTGVFVATVALQRSFDQGTTWTTVNLPGTTTAVSTTAPQTYQLEEAERDVWYRAACTAFTSGTANWRISQ